MDAAAHGVSMHTGRGQEARGGGNAVAISLKGGAQVDEAVYGHAWGTRQLEDIPEG